MHQLLRIGDQVTLQSGLVCSVERFLGGGTQGEVYQAWINTMPVALKWYFPDQATPEQYQSLAELVRRGAPTDTFLWPQDLAVQQSGHGFGYTMPLREDRFRGLVDWVTRRVKPTFRAVITAGYHLTDGFYQLHATGLSYYDISFGNVFFDPQQGDVRICDNDNVTVADAGVRNVLGTPRFMAPEIVRGEALPSTATDLYSLSVLLFYMLFLAHPLEGAEEARTRSLDMISMKRLYGDRPLFIFDPHDVTNRPVRGIHDNAEIYWSLYPAFLKNAFIRAFTDGLVDPQNGRVQESEWREILVRLRDAIVYCPSCGVQCFFDAEAGTVAGAHPGRCWRCDAMVTLPFRLQLGKNRYIMLNQDTRIFPHHIDGLQRFNFHQPVGVISQHPSDPMLWGLKNVSNESWTIIPSDEAQRDLPPGRSTALTHGTKINFGRTVGEILYAQARS